jgi:hypothetical protein
MKNWLFPRISKTTSRKKLPNQTHAMAGMPARRLVDQSNASMISSKAMTIVIFRVEDGNTRVTLTNKREIGFDMVFEMYVNGAAWAINCRRYPKAHRVLKSRPSGIKPQIGNFRFQTHTASTGMIMK